MSNSKPNCADFIIATIRRLRLQKQSSKVPDGLALWKVYELAAEVYSDEEFREAIASLLKREELLIYAKTVDHEMDPQSKRIHRLPERVEKVTALPRRLPNGLINAWMINDKGNVVTKKRGSYKLVIPRLYVKADGLPSTIAKLEESPKPTAKDIIASMRAT